MDTDLLAFVTGLDPKEAEDVAIETDPSLAKNKNKKKMKKVSMQEPALKRTNLFQKSVYLAF